jgi:cytochrome P450
VFVASRRQTTNILITEKITFASQLSDRQLQDEVITLINAGHETTATALAWTWYLIGTHPDVMVEMQDEIQTVLIEPLRLISWEI